MILLDGFGAALLLLVVEEGEGVVGVRAPLHHQTFDRSELGAVLPKLLLQNTLSDLRSRPNDLAIEISDEDFVSLLVSVKRCTFVARRLVAFLLGATRLVGH